MKKKKVEKVESKKSKDLALHYMKTLVDVARESFLILAPDLKVISANPIFYETFHVSARETKDKFLYNLGNDQWDIPELKKLLKEILPKKKIVKNYEVEHKFEKIGLKIMLLNAKQVDSVQLIILAIEDATIRTQLENKLSENVKQLSMKVKKRTAELVDRVKELEKLNQSMIGREVRMVELKKQIEQLRKKR